MRSRARDSLWALVIGFAALALYLATLQPDFGGPEDTPKFQFLGYVLGTAHPPGYPLYVLLSHFFVKLPIRTIAYRANLFSAVMAAVACVMTYAIARQMGAARWAAACAALGLATGASFWRSGLIAEVYSLAAVMVALTIVLLMRWSAGGGSPYLLAAVAAFALGLGNHLTIVGLVPAAVVFVLWRASRSPFAGDEHDVGAGTEHDVAQPFRAAPALSFRLVVVAAVILLLGVSQYGFIILRTYQGAPHLESRAGSLSELYGVVTAQRFAKQRFAFTPRTVLTEQAPVVLSVIARELGVLGVVFLAAGLVAIAWRPNAAGMLVAGAALGMLAMVVNLSGDLKGFITPIVVLLWPLVALGADAVKRVVESPRVVRTAVTVLATVAMSAIPVRNVLANYSELDRSSQLEEGRFFRSLFAQLPDRAAIVAEDYFFDMALLYYEVTGEGGPGRGIVRIPFDPRVVREAAQQGRRVFAFGRAATFFGAQGLSFERATVAGPSFAQWLGTLPRGTVIAGAAAYSAVPFEFSAIDRHQSAATMPRSHPFAAFALAAPGSAHVEREGDDALSLPVDRGTLPAANTPVPGALSVAADERGARVEFAGRTIAAVDKGLVLGVFNADGTLWRTLEFPSGSPLRVEPEAAIYELKAESPCVEITTGRWTDIAPVLSTGSWLATVPEVGSVTIEAELPVWSIGPNAGVDELLAAGVARRVSRTASADGTVTLVTELTRNVYGRPLFRMAVDNPPSQARARIRSGGKESNVTLCAHRPPPLFAADSDRAAVRPDFESEAYFGSGWRDSERTLTGRVRRADRRATLLLPLAAGYSYQLSLDFARTPAHLDASLNGKMVGACELGELRTVCDVVLPSTIVRDGANSLTLTAVPLSPSAPAPVIFQGAHIVRRPDR
jgi:Protein O-mannosyl-transferase TMEM260-like